MGLLGFIGLDGMAWHIILSYAAHGCFKNVLRLAAQGVYAVNICYPPYTPPSWTTIFTGVKPSTHKILGFMKPYVAEDGSLRFKPYSALDIEYPRLTEILAMNDLRGITINHPLSYPVNGWYARNQIIVSDDASPRDFVYPSRYNTFLKYFKKVKVRGARGDDKWISRLNSSLEAKIDGVLKLVDEFSPDFLVIILREPDTIMHYLPYVARGVVNERVCEVFKTIDEFIGAMSKVFKSISIASDHGFDLYDKRVNLWFALSALSNSVNKLSISSSILSIILQSELSRILTKWLVLDKRLVKVFYGVRSYVRRKLEHILGEYSSHSFLNPSGLSSSIALDPIDGDDALVVYTRNRNEGIKISRYLYEYFREYIDGIEHVRLRNGIVGLLIYLKRKHIHLGNDPKFPRARLLKIAATRHSPYGIFILKSINAKTSSPIAIRNTSILPTILQVLGIPLPIHVEGRPIASIRGKTVYKDYIPKWRILRKIYWVKVVKDNSLLR